MDFIPKKGSDLSIQNENSKFYHEMVDEDISFKKLVPPSGNQSQNNFHLNPGTTNENSEFYHELIDEEISFKRAIPNSRQLNDSNCKKDNQIEEILKDVARDNSHVPISDPLKITKRASARVASGKQAFAKQELKAAGNWVVAKQAPAKKDPAKQVPAKQVPAKKAIAKQVPAKQVPAKKDPAKQVPAKQVTAKQVPAKKTIAKQVPAKQVPAKYSSDIEVSARPASVKWHLPADSIVAECYVAGNQQFAKNAPAKILVGNREAKTVKKQPVGIQTARKRCLVSYTEKPGGKKRTKIDARSQNNSMEVMVETSGDDSNTSSNDVSSDDILDEDNNWPKSSQNGENTPKIPDYADKDRRPHKFQMKKSPTRTGGGLKQPTKGKRIKCGPCEEMIPKSKNYFQCQNCNWACHSECRGLSLSMSQGCQ